MTKANNLVTKPYLDKKLKTFKIELKDELKKDLKQMNNELGRELKGDLYEIKDEIVGEIKTSREESDTHQYSHVRINEELEEHDKKITKLQVAR